MKWHTFCAHLEECALTYMPDTAIHICIKVWKTAPRMLIPCPPSWSSCSLLFILTYCHMISLVWCLRETITAYRIYPHGCLFHLDSWPCWM